MAFANLGTGQNKICQHTWGQASINTVSCHYIHWTGFMQQKGAWKKNEYIRPGRSHIALLLVAKLLPDGSARPPEQSRISRHERASSTHDVRREVVRREKRILHFTTHLCVGQERFFCRGQRFANPLLAALATLRT
jgi:hypothetical protein